MDKVKKTQTRMVLASAIAAGLGGLVGLGIVKSFNDAQTKQLPRINNPVLMYNKDKNRDITKLYEGTRGDRSRDLKKVGEFRYLLVVPDLDNSAQPYVEIEQPGLIEVRQATLHIGRNQPLPLYEPLRNDGQFDR